MIERRILYVAALCAVALFYIFHTGYFSWVMLLLAIGFLPMELLLSLPGFLKHRLSYTVQADNSQNDLVFTLSVDTRSSAPFNSMRAVLVCKNQFTGHVKTKRLRLRSGTVTQYTLKEEQGYCGAIYITLQSLRIIDVAGLVALPMRKLPPVVVFMRPAFPSAPPPLPDAALDQSNLPHQKTHLSSHGAVREFTDIREYREGDSVRDIHWKLTAKLDKMIVREGSTSAKASPHICFDFFGNTETACHILGRVEALSTALWELERLHGLHWLNPQGKLESRYIASKPEYDEFLWELMQTPLPATGNPVAEHLPLDPGPKMVVGTDTISLYEDGRLKEVLQ